MWHRYELYFIDIIKGRQKGMVSSLLKWCLQGFSWVYRLGMWGFNRAYDRRWLRQYISPVPVISIGNIVTGGTGKTPATLMLAKHFCNNLQVAVLSRGYRSAVEKLPSPVVVSGGKGPLHPASFCGDEPFILAKRLPGTFVIAGRNRRKASSMAVAAGAQLLLLDDGMQHRGLARDFEVVVLDGNDPFGQGKFLPAGFLREGVSALSRAHLILLNHIHSAEKFQEIKEIIIKHTQAPIVGMSVIISHIWNNQGQDLKTLQGKRVGMFCGIANPNYFRQTLERMGAEVVAEFTTGDHLSINSQALQRFSDECVSHQAEMMVCTEKDKVKLPDNLSLSLPISWVEIELKPVHGEEAWNKFIEDVRHKTLH